MEINVNLENKEQALDLLAQITDNFGITKTDLNESYASSTIGGGISNKKVKNKCRIRIIDLKECILKLMVPYGDKSYIPSNYAYPWKRSEGKYGIMCNVNDPQKRTGSNRIRIINNYYAHATGDYNRHPTALGMLGNGYYRPDTNNTYNIGYGTVFQDNYESLLEIPVQNYYGENLNVYPYYSRNGDCGFSSNYGTSNKGFINYKNTSNSNYRLFLPIFNT